MGFVLSICFTRVRLARGITVLTMTFRSRCRSVEPPVEPDQPKLEGEGGLGGAGMASTGCGPMPKSTLTMMRGEGAGVMVICTPRRALTSDVPWSDPGRFSIGGLVVVAVAAWKQ